MKYSSLIRFSLFAFCLLASFNSLVSAEETEAAQGGYLFTTFHGEGSAMGEQIYFAISQDGQKWESLNDSKPVLVSELGEKGVRDPFLIRANDGNGFYLIATDLSIFHNHDWGRAVRGGSHAIIIWHSSDLVNWSEPWRVEVAPEDAGCTWAPEVVYDNKKDDYLVFWASTTKRDDFGKHRIWAARTKDFRTFDEPFIYIEKEHAVIDTTIIHNGEAYYRFTKDEKFKAITLEEADELEGEWRDISEFSLGRLRRHEGPTCFAQQATKAGEPTEWYLLLDFYGRGKGYQPYVTTDLSKGQFEPLDSCVFPHRFRHGSVLSVSAEEYAGLEARKVQNETAVEPASN